jgi:hypothetical protein
MIVMKTLLQKLSIAILSIALITPSIEAQSRTTGNRGGGNNNSSQNVGGSSSNRNSGGFGNQGGSNSNKQPSINQGSTTGNRNLGNKQPNLNQGNNNRPGNQGNINNNNRPNNGGGNNNWHFGGNQQPQQNRPGAGPGIINQPGPVNRPHAVQPSMRPNRPIAGRWNRPVPPASWRPRAGAPILQSILGLAFGTAINLSLDYLLNQGYVVDGYGSNVVYLRDINQFNYFWPDATLYYNNGGLARSEFFDSTTYPNMYRYNSLYNTFISAYGAPVNYSNNGSAVTATWFSSNNGYITLQYNPQVSMGGQMRYFTTVTIGL